MTDKSKPSFILRRRWCFVLMVSLALYVALGVGLAFPIAAEQSTTTPNSFPLAKMPIQQIAGFEDVIVGQTLWSDVVPLLISLGYDVHYAFSNDYSEAVYEILISDPTGEVPQTPHVAVEAIVSNDKVAFLYADFSHPLTDEFPTSVWQLVNPTQLLISLGTPDRLRFNAAGGITLQYGLTLFWHNSNLAGMYEADILPQDNLGTTFRICTHISRIHSVTLFEASSFADLQKRMKDMNLMNTISDLTQDMFIGQGDLKAIAQQLATQQCLITPVGYWKQLQNTWTPWPGYTDTATPTLAKTITPMRTLLATLIATDE